MTIGLIIIASNNNYNNNSTNNVFSNFYNETNTISSDKLSNIDLENISDIPEYTGDFIVTINNSTPSFVESDFSTESFVKLSDLDDKKRAGVAYANLSIDLLPDDSVKRERVSDVYTSGWVDSEYDSVPNKKLYNKSHLIAFSLIGNLDNEIEKNLITGTHDLNTKGMTSYENDIPKYFEKYPNNHVLYRVTPVFKGDNLVATGVQMEAESVEDRGESLKFNVFIYNIQSGIEIDYRNRRK